MSSATPYGRKLSPLTLRNYEKTIELACDPWQWERCFYFGGATSRFTASARFFGERWA